eukprot:5548844-Pleurochrysis_carterae.AAC.1
MDALTHARAHHTHTTKHAHSFSYALRHSHARTPTTHVTRLVVIFCELYKAHRTPNEAFTKRTTSDFAMKCELLVTSLVKRHVILQCGVMPCPAAAQRRQGHSAQWPRRPPVAPPDP